MEPCWGALKENKGEPWHPISTYQNRPKCPLWTNCHQTGPCDVRRYIRDKEQNSYTAQCTDVALVYLPFEKRHQGPHHSGAYIGLSAC